MSASALAETPLWLSGPDWLYSKAGLLEESNPDIQELPVPNDCQSEMKCKEAAHSLVTLDDNTP